MVQVGTTKDQGLYNKPLTAVHPGASAAGTLPQYNTRVLYSVKTLYNCMTAAQVTAQRVKCAVFSVLITRCL